MVYFNPNATGKRNKYGAESTIIDGIRFASKKESKRYIELRLLEKAGEITELVLQPKYPLMVGDEKPVKSRTKRYPNGRKVTYIADFKYYDVKKGAPVVEDVKGMDTPASRIKRACVEAYYGIQIILT